MKELTKENLKNYANKLMFEMDEKEYETLLIEFDITLKQMELIGKIKGIDNVTPMTFPYKIDNKKFRPDEIKEPITAEEALSNSKEKVGNEVKVPKVVE